LREKLHHWISSLIWPSANGLHAHFWLLYQAVQVLDLYAVGGSLAASIRLVSSYRPALWGEHPHLVRNAHSDFSSTAGVSCDGDHEP
jgi:hypothetical protein